ncbi:MAG: hemerythrin domain-containing protein [Chromatiaceae bacterium]|nr:MAG: hemerythrin domain-containing protein [Chromatiaceae bacterium]
MRRIPPLRRLSREHHTGLVLAKRARAAAAGPAPVQAAAWAELRARFDAELAPHFALEEQGLLAAMAAAGETALVARTLAEHAALRELIAAEQPAHLATFSDLLTAHIRFEEAELFAAAQRVLDAPTLARLAELHAAAPAPRCALRLPLVP